MFVISKSLLTIPHIKPRNSLYDSISNSDVFAILAFDLMSNIFSPVLPIYTTFPFATVRAVFTLSISAFVFPVPFLPIRSSTIVNLPPLN